MKTKEEILKEFEILSEKERRELTKGCFYQDEPRDNYNKIIKRLTQTREETIREVEERLSKIIKYNSEIEEDYKYAYGDLVDEINKLKK